MSTSRGPFHASSTVNGVQINTVESYEVPEERTVQAEETATRGDIDCFGRITAKVSSNVHIVRVKAAYSLGNCKDTSDAHVDPGVSEAR